jgi:nuclear GTP-binding protein
MILLAYKGGVPDLIAAATSILRDWNAGKIPYYTKPPKTHPSGNLKNESELPTAPVEGGMEVDNGPSKPVGGDAILQGLSEAFDLDGLFSATGSGEFEAGDAGDWVDDVEELGEVYDEDIGEIEQISKPDMPVDEE